MYDPWLPAPISDGRAVGPRSRCHPALPPDRGSHGEVQCALFEDQSPWDLNRAGTYRENQQRRLSGNEGEIEMRDLGPAPAVIVGIDDWTGT
jgi:hypothetical protein